MKLLVIDIQKGITDSRLFNFEAFIDDPIRIIKAARDAGQDLNSFLPRNEARVSFEYTEDTMEEIISATALYVKERLMPIFNRVYDLDSFIDFLKEYSINKLRACVIHGMKNFLAVFNAEEKSSS